MRNFLIYFILLTLAGCGVKLETDPIEVEPIEVTHTVTISATDLVDFFTQYCENKHTVESEIDTCVAESLALFWAALDETAPGQVEEEE